MPTPDTRSLTIAPRWAGETLTWTIDDAAGGLFDRLAIPAGVAVALTGVALGRILTFDAGLMFFGMAAPLLAGMAMLAVRAVAIGLGARGSTVVLALSQRHGLVVRRGVWRSVFELGRIDSVSVTRRHGAALELEVDGRIVRIPARAHHPEALEPIAREIARAARAARAARDDAREGARRHHVALLRMMGHAERS